MCDVRHGVRLCWTAQEYANYSLIYWRMLLPFDYAPAAARTPVLDAWAQQLDARVLPRRWFGRLRRALEAEAVAASTSMEGVPITVEDAMKILAGDHLEHVSASNQALVRGYREAMTYVQRRADDGRMQWNRELVVAVQDRVLAGNFATGAGRLRERATWVTNSQNGAVVFQPPDHERVPELVDEMCVVMAEADWHPAIAAAWIHVAVAAIHPFRDGNGRTARVLSSLTMYRGGFKHPAFTNLEEWWGKNTGTYYAAFECLGATFERGADVTPFVQAHLDAQLRQVYLLALRQRTEGLLWTALENLLEDRGLPSRLANALYDSFFGRSVTTGYYRDLINASPATARNDLQAAVAAGFLRAIGQTRGRRYEPGGRLMPALSRGLGGEVLPEQVAILDALVNRVHEAADLLPDPDALGQQTLPGLP
jgi:Fic family protein